MPEAQSVRGRRQHLHRDHLRLPGDDFQSSGTQFDYCLATPDLGGGKKWRLLDPEFRCVGVLGGDTPVDAPAEPLDVLMEAAPVDDEVRRKGIPQLRFVRGHHGQEVFLSGASELVAKELSMPSQVAERAPLLAEESIKVVAVQLKSQVFDELQSPVSGRCFTLRSRFDESGGGQGFDGWFVHTELMRPRCRSVRIVFFEDHDGTSPPWGAKLSRAPQTRRCRTKNVCHSGRNTFVTG